MSFIFVMNIHFCSLIVLEKIVGGFFSTVSGLLPPVLSKGSSSIVVIECFITVCHLICITKDVGVCDNMFFRFFRAGLLLANSARAIIV